MIIFLTGTTGLLGGELLVRLSKRPDVTRIFCLIRCASEEAGIKRLEGVFDLHDDEFDQEKVRVIPGDLGDDGLTDSLIAHPELREVEVVIHSAANTSFARVNDAQVEKINIEGLGKVVAWARQLDTLQTFLYIGTATICGKDHKNRVVYEDESPNPNASHLVRYTYTKAQGEMQLERELPAEKILIARPSIIMGDSRSVVPRSPVILWAVATINILRLCPFNPNSALDVISVDFAAESIIALLFSKRQHRVYHISSGVGSSTTPYRLHKAFDPYFENLPAYKFVPKFHLNEFKLWSKNILSKTGSDDFTEYFEHWENMFLDKRNLRIIFSGIEPYIDFIELGHIFDNSRLLEDTGIVPPQPAHEYILNSIDYLKSINIIEGAYEP